MVVMVWWWLQKKNARGIFFLFLFSLFFLFRWKANFNSYIHEHISQISPPQVFNGCLQPPILEIILISSAKSLGLDESSNKVRYTYGFIKSRNCFLLQSFTICQWMYPPLPIRYFVSLFNGIPTFVGYLMPKPFF